MFDNYKKILARSLDFVPIIGPILMLTWYIKWIDFISKIHFKRTSRKWLGFLGSAVFTLLWNIFFFGELLDIAWYMSFPFSFKETAFVLLLVSIAWYICHAIFLWNDLFQGIESRLAKKSTVINKLKNKKK